MKTYRRYSISALFEYNGATVLHYGFGAAGIIIGYNASLAVYIGGFVYFIFALVQMYIIMPLIVCPNCVYYRMSDSLCTSGLNVVSKKIARAGKVEDFSHRGEGILSHNNMYISALFVPIVAMIPALVINFSFTLLAIFLVVVGLLVLRMFIVFPKVACIHCSARRICPNAQSMGLSEK